MRFCLLLLPVLLFVGCSRTRDTLYNSHSVWTTNQVVVDGITNEVITQLTQYTVRPEVSGVVHTVGVFAPGWGTLGAAGAGLALGMGGMYLNGKRKKHQTRPPI